MTVRLALFSAKPRSMFSATGLLVPASVLFTLLSDRLLR